MKISFGNNTTQTRPITTNDVPVGTVFRGTITGAVNKVPTTGIFYKASGRFRASNGVDRILVDTCVVRLDSTDSNPGHVAVWLPCAKVDNYEPLDVELAVKGVL